MARKPQVTRTFRTTTVNVLCLNIEEGEPFNMAVTLPRTFADDKKLMKAVESMVNTESVKAVHIVEKIVNDVLYGMSEEKFIANAEILPPRASANNENETEDNAE